MLDDFESLKERNYLCSSENNTHVYIVEVILFFLCSFVVSFVCGLVNFSTGNNVLKLEN